MPGKIKHECKECESVFMEYASQNKDFCNKECYDEWQSEDWPVLECEYCGQHKEVKPCKKERFRFCSNQCMQNWKSENMSGEDSPHWEGGFSQNDCEWCGETIKEPTRQNQRFCSSEHWGEWSSENRLGKNHHLWKEYPEVECEWCSSTSKVIPAREDTAKFCDKQCRGKWVSENKSGKDHPRWGGGTAEYYGPNWGQQRRKALERDGNECRVCGFSSSEEERGLHVHHKTPFRLFGDEWEFHELANDLTNLVSLCPSCHIDVEEMYPIFPEEITSNGYA